MPKAFREDFFERVTDVKWEIEPDVYWMAGTGFPLITNGMVLFDRPWVYASPDGKHWKGIDARGAYPTGFSAFYAGGWMRTGLQEGEPPCWVLAGASSKGVVEAATGYSTDGQMFDIMTKTTFDDRHAVEAFSQAGSGTVALLSRSLFISEFPHRHLSSNGRTWQPLKFHGDSGGERAADQFVGALSSSSSPTSPVLSISIDDPKRYYEQEFHNRTPLLLPKQELLVPTLRADEGGSGLQKKADQIVLVPSGISATGKCNKGQYKGKYLEIKIEPYHFFPEGGDYGESTIEGKAFFPDGTPIIDEETGEPKKFNADTGIPRSISIGYGKYVWVVGGATKPASVDQGVNQMTAISWSEDGTSWKHINLGPTGQINPICVGPRPKKQ